MVKMNDLAHHILAVSKQNKLEVTNLQLQKIMFFILGKNRIDYKKNLQNIKIEYDLTFSRWMYGPVVSEIYFKYNHYGSRPIYLDEIEPISELSEYDEDIIKLSKVDPFKLVEITHMMPSWAKYKEDIIARKYVPDYTEEEILKGFTPNDRKH